MNDDESAADLFDRLAHEFAERCRGGEHVPMSEYVDKYPELAEQIRELFPALVVMEQFGSVADAGSANGLPAAGSAIPQRLGEYRILREIARGGMGVVYEAVQESLGRHVALKILPSHSAAQGQHLERFRREARAAARLHHTNIVPVFGVGEHEGIHYFAMQYIQGQTLSSVLHEIKHCRDATLAESPRTCADEPEAATNVGANVAQQLLDGRFQPPPVSPETSVYQQVRLAEDDFFPPAGAAKRDRDVSSADKANSHSDWIRQPEQQYFRSVARVGVQVAEALAYAHQQGILHRDIKPGNLLLDLQGTVWITDFGLAKADDVAQLTNAGDIVGTLAYMAPERFSGVSEPRGDVYSLGLTLYEMATLQPAYADSDQAQLIKNIMDHVPPRPRQVNPHVPRSLETILLKASARAPEQRYASAAALAEDLQRFLDGRPIRARRAVWAEQVWRWCRRNPGVAGLCAAVAVLVVALAVGAWVGNLLRDERDVARDSQQRAEQAEQRAREAERENKMRAHLARATAYRHSGQSGQRFLTLAEIRAAMKLQPDEELRRELRNEAIAAIALPDVHFRTMHVVPAETRWVDFDAAHTVYARTDRLGACSVRRRADDVELYRLPAMGKLACCWLHPEGRFLAVHTVEEDRALQELKCWRLENGKATLLFTATGMHNVCFHPRKRHVAVTRANGSIDVHDLTSGKRVHHLPRHVLSREVTVALHPTEPLIAAASYFTPLVLIRDLRDGKVVASLPLQRAATGLAWSPDGQTLALGGGESFLIHLYDRGTWQPYRTFKGSQKGAFLTYNHRGDRLAVGGWAGIIDLFDVGTGQKVFSTTTPTWSGLRFSSDDCTLAGGLPNGKVGIWQVGNGREVRTFRRAAMPNNVDFIFTAVSPDGSLVAAGMNDGFGLWDSATGSELCFVALGCGNEPNGVLFEPSGALLTPSSTGVYRWPIRKDPKTPGTLILGPSKKLAIPKAGNLAASRDGKVLAACSRAVGVWQDAAGGWILHRDRPDNPIRIDAGADISHVAVSPDGQWVITVYHNPGLAKVWRAADGSFVKELADYGTWHPHFSRDGRWLSTGVDGGRLYEVGTWEQGLRTGAGGAFAPPEQQLMAVPAEAGILRFVNPETGNEYARLSGTNCNLLCTPTFSADGTKLVVTSSTPAGLHVVDLRQIRRQLKEMNLDWDAPPYPPATDPAESVRRVIIQGREKLTDALTPEIRIKAAIQRHRQRLEANPNDAAACNGLAWNLLTAPAPLRGVKAALPLAEKAVKLVPKNPAYVNTLGIAHYYNGRYREAVKTLTQNSRDDNNPYTAWDLYFLAMAHHQLGETVQARIYLDWAGNLTRLRTSSSPHERAELAAFRAEAEALLGLPKK